MPFDEIFIRQFLGQDGEIAENSDTLSPHTRYLDAACDAGNVGSYTKENILLMQQAMRDALHSRDPLPDEMRSHLALAFEFLCNGFEYDLLTPAVSRGGRENPVAMQAQEAAIRYLRWVGDGRITDQFPVRSVASAYKVTERTVRNWIKSWSSKPTPPILEEFGADGVDRFMKATGKQYHRFSRSRGK